MDELDEDCRKTVDDYTRLEAVLGLAWVGRTRLFAYFDDVTIAAPEGDMEAW